MASRTQPHYTPPQSQQGGIGVWYRAVIVVMAVVLVGLPWCQTEQSGYVADGTAMVTSDSPEPEAHAHLQPMMDEILKQTTADAEFAAYLNQHPELKQELRAKTNQDAIELFRRRLEVDPTRVGGKITIHLRFFASDRKLCTDVMSQFLIDFQDKFDAWKREKSSAITTSLSQELAAAQAKLNQIDGELQRYQKEAAVQPPSQTATANVPKVSPEWAAISMELKEARQVLQQLLITRTERHPLVVDQNDKIASLTKQLSSTAKYPVPVNATPQSLDEQKGALAAERQFQIDDLQKQRKEVEARLTTLAHRKQDADQALGFIQGIHMEVPGDQVQVATIGGVWKMGALLVLGGWVIFLGLIAFQMAWSASRPVPIRSAGTLASATSVPVVATISIAGSSIPMPTGRSLVGPCSFLLTRAAELTVIGVLGLVLLATQTNPQLGDLLHDDPLGVVRESLRVLFPSAQ
ncbi:hypothetical protein [Blastopirellula marina]|nr:hypothetical protein [Blastopirellula marina]